MKTRKHMDEISRVLESFSEQSRGRSTRLAVFEGEPSYTEDYWLEDGLPLTGIDLDPNGVEGPEIELMLGAGPASKSHMTRRIRGVSSIRITLSMSGHADAVEISDGRGQTTVLRFEDMPKVSRRAADTSLLGAPAAP